MPVVWLVPQHSALVAVLIRRLNYQAFESLLTCVLAFSALIQSGHHCDRLVWIVARLVTRTIGSTVSCAALPLSVSLIRSTGYAPNVCRFRCGGLARPAVSPEGQGGRLPCNSITQRDYSTMQN